MIVVVFFTVYTAAGMVGGGKLFEMAFGGGYMTGIWVTAGVVLVYTMIGGFLAVSLTDFVQGCIMFGALVLMPLVLLLGRGGLRQLPAREWQHPLLVLLLLLLAWSAFDILFSVDKVKSFKYMLAKVW